MSNRDLYFAALKIGAECGESARIEGWPAPNLSGEFAGESISERLLWKIGIDSPSDISADLLEWLCDAFQMGSDSAYYRDADGIPLVTYV